MPLTPSSTITKDRDGQRFESIRTSAAPSDGKGKKWTVSCEAKMSVPASATEIVASLSAPDGSRHVQACNGRGSILVRTGGGESVVAVRVKGVATSFIRVN